MNDFVLKISKTGDDIRTVERKRLAFDSTLDTMKVARSGQLYIDLPAESDISGLRVRTASYLHDLGYVPMFTPPVNDVLYSGGISGGGDWIVNEEYSAALPSEGAITLVLDEWAGLRVTSTEIILEVTRFDAFGGNSFGARRCTVNYTLFYNQMDEAMDLL